MLLRSSDNLCVRVDVTCRKRCRIRWCTQEHSQCHKNSLLWLCILKSCVFQGYRLVVADWPCVPTVLATCSSWKFPSADFGRLQGSYCYPLMGAQLDAIFSWAVHNFIWIAVHWLIIIWVGSLEVEELIIIIMISNRSFIDWVIDSSWLMAELTDWR